MARFPSSEGIIGYRLPDSETKYLSPMCKIKSIESEQSYTKRFSAKPFFLRDSYEASKDFPTRAPNNLQPIKSKDYGAMEDEYKQIIEFLQSKIKSRDTVISSFEETTSLQHASMNKLRKDLEKKNEEIDQLKTEQYEISRHQRKLVIDLDIEKRITKKLNNKVNQLKAELIRTERSNIERRRKNDQEKKKLNQLVHLLKAQISAKDNAIREIFSAYQPMKKTVADMIKSIRVVEAELLSRVSNKTKK